jgi:OmpA-OmpF porin, OOP family
MYRHHLRTSLAALIAASTITQVDSALAQQPPLALERFTPAPAGDRLFGVPSPYVAGHGQLHLMLLGDYAHDPLVLVRESDDARLASTVEHQLFLHLNASFALWDRLSVDLDAPMAVVQEGETVGGIAGASGAAFGDVRLGGRLRLIGDYYDPFQVGIGGYVWLPTGPDSGFVSDGAARGMPYLSMGGRVPRFFWTVASGVEVRRAQTIGGSGKGRCSR